MIGIDGFGITPRRSGLDPMVAGDHGQLFGLAVLLHQFDQHRVGVFVFPSKCDPKPLFVELRCRMTAGILGIEDQHHFFSVTTLDTISQFVDQTLTGAMQCGRRIERFWLQPTLEDQVVCVDNGPDHLNIEKEKFVNATSEKLNFARTKIVATVGPASKSPEMIRALIVAGVDVFRLNMAHGTIDEKVEIIRHIRSESESLDIVTGILVDLAGPKIRLGKLHNDAVTLINGEQVSFVRGTESNDPKELVCLYEPLIAEVSEGEMIVLADGISRLMVKEKSADRLVCEVNDGGVVRTRQGVNLPSTDLSVPALGSKDIEHAKWAAEQQVDFVSLSFVRNASEIESLQGILAECNCAAHVVAKIEKAEALDNLEAIVATSDGVMVARGDLGVEIDIAKTPVTQKQIIDCCSRHRKPVIVATQMLESMHSCKQPTRAEVSDVANAILDGADACMLSGETAVGEYPIESVQMMNRIMLETERTFHDVPARRMPADAPAANRVSEVVACNAAEIARQIEAKLVVIASSTIETARLTAKQRNVLPAVCVAKNLDVARQMSLLWGVIPLVTVEGLELDRIQRFSERFDSRCFELSAGDLVVVVTDSELLAGVHDSIMVTKVE